MYHRERIRIYRYLVCTIFVSTFVLFICTSTCLKKQLSLVFCFGSKLCDSIGKKEKMQPKKKSQSLKKNKKHMACTKFYFLHSFSVNFLPSSHMYLNSTSEIVLSGDFSYIGAKINPISGPPQ